MSYNFVQVNEFQPTVGDWNVVSNVTYNQIDATHFEFTDGKEVSILVSFLSPSLFRVTFNPPANSAQSYDPSQSFAVVNYAIAPVTVRVTETTNTVTFNTGNIKATFGLDTYGYQVWDANNNLVIQTVLGRNLVYSNNAFACIHDAMPADGYYGFGEKAGAQLNKKTFSLNFFNFDNFSYGSSVAIPPGNAPGPLNPSEPLYNSTPFLLTVGQPTGANTLYSYGLFFDSPSQSFFNLGANDYPEADMTDKYYFGSVYGQLDYYIMVGNNTGNNNPVKDVVNQFTQLTGRPAMPPMYALGYHQGGYGYATKEKLMDVADKYRASNFPIDGLHIDVDFQDNYRTFTASKLKFPDPAGMFSILHTMGFKCSTNITGIVTANPLDEMGENTPYPTRDNVIKLDPNDATKSTYLPNAPVKPFLAYPPTETGAYSSTPLYYANENYGDGTQAVNPFIPEAYPSPAHPEGTNILGTYGYYSDLGNPSVQTWWGQQYQNLLTWGLDMIWQDMTCPAIALNDGQTDLISTLPLDIAMYDKRTKDYVPNIYIHNSFAINLVQASYNGITTIKEAPSFAGNYNYQKRNFIIARGGYAGIQKYAGLWTGDSASSWQFLAINIPEVLNFGLSGIPITGSDVGGFANGDVPQGGFVSSELYVRWMTSAAFLPWYRNHYDQYTKAFQEPYAYRDNGIQGVFEATLKYVQMRYQLLQLFYDCAYEASQAGTPIARSLFLNDPQDTGVYNTLIMSAPGIGDLYALDCQFFVGNDLLVAPVVTQNTFSRNVYLPKGSDWYVFDINGGQLTAPNTGGQSINWQVPIDLVPLYVREGAIIPVRELEMYVGEKNINPLTFFIYPFSSNNHTGNSSYTLYQDDKISTAAFQKKTPAYRTTNITSNSTASQRQVSINRTYDKYQPQEPYYYVAFLGVETIPSSVTAGTTKLQGLDSMEDLQQSADNAFFYDATNDKLLVKVFDMAKSVTINVA